MAGQSLVYSNARVKAMENSLLTQEKITRMTYASSLDEAVKVLYESSYGGGVMVDSPYAFGDILRAEDVKVTDFMREAMPEGSGLETLLTPLDYHNAKAALKAKACDIKDVEIMLSPSGNMDRAELLDIIGSDNLHSLPDEMASAVSVVEQAIADGSVTPRMIDVELDKALYTHIMRVMAKCKAKSLVKYWTSRIDLTNISTLLRCKRIGADEKFFAESIMPGGSINDYVLIPLLKESYDTIADKLRYTDYGTLVDIAVGEVKAGEPLVRFEAEWDNYLLDIFKTDKADIFSIAPIAGFYIAKKVELKMVRMILTSIKNSADESKIKARLRGFYA